MQRISRAAALVLVLLPLCFTGRALLTGRVYAPIDLPFMSEPLRAYRNDFGITGDALNGNLSDLYMQIMPWRQAVSDALTHREWPLWNPYMLCGDILAGAAQPAPYDPFRLLALLLPMATGLTFSASITFFLAAFSAFAFARAIGCRERAAFIAAAGWMCSANMAFFVGWPMARAWALLPLVLFAVRWLIVETSLRSAVWLTLVLVVEILAGHPETLLHVVAIGIVYALFEHPSLRAIALGCLCGLIALGITAIFLLPFLDAAPQSVQHGLRSWFAHTPFPTDTQAIAHRARAWLLPHAPRDADSGGTGFVVLALALAALILARRRRERWFFFALAVVGVLAGINAPPVAGWIHRLPLFRMAVNERLIFAADFSLALLAALAVESYPQLVQHLFIALLLLERLLEVGSLYPTLPARAFYPVVPTLAAIPRTGEPFRIAALYYHFVPDSAAFYGLEDVRGYSAMNNERLAATIPLWSTQQPVSFNLIEAPPKPFLSFLNVRYLLTSLDQTLPPQWKLIAQDRGGKLFENTAFVPRAFVPPLIHYQSSAGNVLLEMTTATDFANQAWIESAAYAPHDTANGPGRVAIRRAKLGLKLDAQMEHAGWIVISETAWRGWRAYVDNRRVQLHYANHAFLGVYVPAGHHRVRLIYLPQSFTRGRAISFTTIALLAISALTRAAIRARRRALRRA